MMYVSLTASLFSALLAMLGKQWLNRYVSTNMRGTAIERSQNRQHKLNGINTWYFEYVLGSLPLILQVSLLLLSCAICQYHWEVDTTIASVVLGVTSFGVVLYLLIVVAGTVSETCPYQTPASCILRSVPSAVVSLTSALGHTIRGISSRTLTMLWQNVVCGQDLQFGGHVVSSLVDVLTYLPVALAFDASILWQAVIQPLVTFAHKVHTWLHGVFSTPTHVSDHQTALLDLQCISWMLKTSLDKADHLSALEFLATMVVLGNFDPTLVVDCFNIFISCVKVVNHNVVITQGLEQLATVSTTCFLHTFSHLSVMDPTSPILKYLHQHYNRGFQPIIDSNNLPFSHTFSVLHSIFHPGQNLLWLDWRYHRPPTPCHITSAGALTKVAWSEYWRRETHKKVPRWILRFVLYSLSLDPLPPTPVITNCLSIIAIDLGCDVPSIGTSILDERSVYIQLVLIHLTQN